jgi:cell division protein FtsQ
MAAVKARLRRRRVYYYEPPPKKAKWAGAPRLAAIQLEGVFGGGGAEPARVTSRGVGMAGAMLALLAAASVAGAAWIGGSLFDLREAAVIAADRAVYNMGFRVENIEIVGARGPRAEEVRALVLPDARASLVSAKPEALKRRLEGLDWVGSAQVRRIWPSTLRIEIVRRRALARWQENGAVSVIDHAGERLFGERVADNLDLPLVVGEGAGRAAAPLLARLDQLPLTRERTRALVRVADRRWNLRLKSGATAALPEADPARALETLETLQARYGLLDRPVERIDLRIPGRLGVRVHPLLAGARHEEGGSA